MFMCESMESPCDDKKRDEESLSLFKRNYFDLIN